MAPMDKDNKLQKGGVIYQFKCPHINCPEEYIGESGRAFEDRIKESLKAPSPVHQHSNSTGHSVSPDCFTTVHGESQGTSRNIKEAMFIHVNDPLLNRNLRGNTNYHTSGTISYRIHQLCSSNRPSLASPLHGQPIHSPTHQYKVGGMHTSFFLVRIPCGGASNTPPSIP